MITFDSIDRQRNEEKKQVAQDETVRLEREKERKRKALTTFKVTKFSMANDRMGLIN